MADIIAELQTIKNGIYGEDIRMAIHDALQKINEDGGGTGNLPVNIASLSTYGLVDGDIETAFVQEGGND